MRRILGLALAALALAGCDARKQVPEVKRETPAPAPGPGPAPAAGLPAGLRLEKAPGGTPLGVGDLKKTAKEGQEVVLRARIGGTRTPFVDGRAAMTVADVKAITSCAEMDMGEDGCKTPWDYCCTPKEELLANTATVRVAGADGKALPADLRTLKGVDSLKVVIVKGVVGPRPDPAILVIDATGIFVE